MKKINVQISKHVYSGPLRWHGWQVRYDCSNNIGQRYIWDWLMALTEDEALQEAAAWLEIPASEIKVAAPTVYVNGCRIQEAAAWLEIPASG
uniref:Uncharacterized protein n=1 Tax=viral metagenome TaxID=1070528 RepID=A0A6M3L3T1_9ZZZZ